MRSGRARRRACARAARSSRRPSGPSMSPLSENATAHSPLAPAVADRLARDAHAAARDVHPVHRGRLLSPRASAPRGPGVGRDDVDARVDVAPVDVEHVVGSGRQRLDAPQALVVLVVLARQLGGDPSVEQDAPLPAPAPPRRPRTHWRSACCSSVSSPLHTCSLPNPNPNFISCFATPVRGGRQDAPIGGRGARAGRRPSRAVVIQLSCIGRAEPNDLRTILPALAEAAEAVDLDHSRLAAVLDWVQYRRELPRRRSWCARSAASPGDARRDGPLAEIAIDVRRAQGPAVRRAGRADRRPPLQGARADPRRPRVHPPRGLGAPVQERHLVVQPQLLAPPRRVGRDLPEGLRVGAARRRLRRDEPGVLGRADRRRSWRRSTASTSGPSCRTRSTCSSSASATASRPRCGWTRSPQRARSRAATTSRGCAT